MTQPAAGWYPQPDGSHRYWDGQGWTNHVLSAAQVAGHRPPQAAAHAAAPGVGAPPVKRRKPIYQRVWFWLIIVAVSLPVIGLMAGKGSSASTSAPAALTSASPGASGAATKKPAKKPSTKKTEAPAPKDVYATLSMRQFKLLAKNPDSYAGKTYVLYGEVTQFDAATGPDTFLASSGPKKLRISYGYAAYAQNSQLTSDELMLRDLVEGDCFKAKVTVLGSFSYDTQAGGNTTVPQFLVDSISVYGNVDE